MNTQLPEESPVVKMPSAEPVPGKFHSSENAVLQREDSNADTREANAAVRTDIEHETPALASENQELVEQDLGLSSPKQPKSRRAARAAEQLLAFPRASKKEYGYKIAQVDAFLAKARATYDSGENGDDAQVISAQEIRYTAFAKQRKGYSARYVDAAMDRLEEVFFERERRQRVREIGEDAWWAETQEKLSDIRGRLLRPRGKRLRRRGLFASGYRRTQVDAFLDRVATFFSGEGQLTTADVRSVVFHSQWRGYSEDQVDALLDSVIEVMLATR